MLQGIARVAFAVRARRLIADATKESAVPVLHEKPATPHWHATRQQQQHSISPCPENLAQRFCGFRPPRVPRSSRAAAVRSPSQELRPAWLTGELGESSQEDALKLWSAWHPNDFRRFRSGAASQTWTRRTEARRDSGPAGQPKNGR